MLPNRTALRSAAAILVTLAFPALAAAAPSATTNTATGVTATSATLAGSVSANFARTNIAFDLGTSGAYGTTIAAAPAQIGAWTFNRAVSGSASDLACATTYYYRVRATNSSGTTLGAGRTFRTTACSAPTDPVAPTATTGAASGVGPNSATFNGSVAAGSAAASVAFEYGLPSSGTASTATATPSSIAAGANGAVSAAASGLSCATTYYYRTRAQSSAGTAYGAVQSFTTASCSQPTPTAPTATTGSASAVGQTQATLNGSATAGSATASVSFDYGTTTGYGSTVNASPASLAANSASTAVSASIPGLACNTTYHFRVRAQSSAGTAQGGDRSFTTASCTAPVVPTATTNAATAIGQAQATLNGSATAGSAQASLSFEYGTTTGYGSSIAATPASLAAGSGPTAASATVQGLACGTTYHFRLRAQGTAGTALGSSRSFATASCSTPPSLSCSSANVRCVAPTAGPNQEYSTIQAAVNAAVPGDTVLVHDGNYAGFVVSRSGTAAAPIAVKAQGTGAVIDRASSAGEGIRVNNAHHVVIEGFTVAGIQSYGLAARGASPTAPMRGVVFRNNTVRDSASSNIYASQVADSLIEGNTTSGSADSHGIYLANGGSDNTVIRGNHAFGNANNGIHLNGDISVGGDGLHSGVVIEENILHDNVANGMDLDGIQSSTIRNNVVYNNGRHGVRAFQIDAAAGPRDLTIVNNTIVVKSGSTPVKLTEDLGGHTIFNNVLVNEGSSGGSIVVGHASVKSNHNTFVNPGFSLNGGSSMLTLAQWRAQAGAYDTASLTSSQDALFVSAAARDYRLKAGAPAANAGVAAFNGRTAPAEDMLAVSRPQGPAHDHGAFESY